MLEEVSSIPDRRRDAMNEKRRYIDEMFGDFMDMDCKCAKITDWKEMFDRADVAVYHIRNYIYNNKVPVKLRKRSNDLYLEKVDE